MWTRITPNTDTFHAVFNNKKELINRLIEQPFIYFVHEVKMHWKLLYIEIELMGFVVYQLLEF